MHFSYCSHVEMNFVVIDSISVGKDYNDNEDDLKNK